ncbi:MAG: TIGR03960 family B12-binding radical SAM protein [Polyangiaceae bacterium]|nr:TIGR03960 family B12-binding radical SAM protein [Polyangiaceae bacterium]
MRTVHPYEPFLAGVEKPTRYTGAEHGARRKDWGQVAARICLAFPEIYDIGMSHLGFRILYRILNDDPRTLAERCYAPWVDLDRELVRHGRLLVSLESARPLADFDVVGFSLQYELGYTNVLRMLDLGGVPLRADRRSDADPLVVAGGPVATHPEPVAPFFDAILIGDGEEAAGEIALSWVRGRRAGLSREERLVALAQLPGVYVPSLYEVEREASTGLLVVTGPREGLAGRVPFPVKRRVVADLSRFPFPDDGPVGGPEAIFDRMSIEIARGCTEGCRFCQAGMIYRPVRERDPRDVVDTVMRAVERSGHDEVSLTALSTADVSCIAPLVHELVARTAPERVSLGVASLRAYGLGEDVLDALGAVRASGLTFAPEAGTQRLRDVINKNVTEEQLTETAERAFSRGFDRMKLYFISGLPTEDDDDLRGIVALGARTLAVGRRLGRRPAVTVSVSVHIPKPHTPFQWCAMDPAEELTRKQGVLRDAARAVRGLQLRLHHDASSVLEGVLARGDRAVADAIEAAYHAGAWFDTWTDRLRLDAWNDAFASVGIRQEAYLGTLPIDARLPWSHLDVGLEPGFLQREYRRALAGRASPPCGKVAGQAVHATNAADARASTRRLVCYDCGVACDLDRMREDRIVALERMGAHEPRRLPVLAEGAPARPPAPRRAAPEAARPARAGTAERFRLRFEKTGPAALLGHLDLGRELGRTLRRAGLRIAYTQGYHPKADLSFGPALSLGIASLDEHVDARLLDAPGVDEVLARLAGAAAPGLRFLAAARLGPQDAGISRVVRGAEYVVAVEPVAGDPVPAARRVEAFLARSEAVVERVVADRRKSVDVRAYVERLTLGDDAALAALDAAGVPAPGVVLCARMAITQAGAAKVSELVQAVFGAPRPHRAARVRLFGEGGRALLEVTGPGRDPPAEGAGASRGAPPPALDPAVLP